MAYNFDTTSPFPYDSSSPVPSYSDTTSFYPYYSDTTSPGPSYDTTSPFPYYDTSSPGPSSYDTTSPGPSSYDTTSPGPYYFDTTSPSPYYDDTTSPGPSYLDTSSPSPYYFDTSSPEPSYDTSSPAPSYIGTTSPPPAPTASMDWTPDTPYKKGQIVFYNGVKYTCNLDILSSPPPNVNMSVWSSSTSPPSIPAPLSEPSQQPPAYDVFSVKQIVTYVLAIALFFIVSRLFIFISDKYKTNINVIMLAGSVVFGLILFGLMYVVNTNIDNFHFELTPIKKCQGGPYMYSSDPERQKLCSHFNKKEYCQYNCGRGFIGAPVHWERSSESDSNWSNSEMTINDSYDYPQVL